MADILGRKHSYFREVDTRAHVMMLACSVRTMVIVTSEHPLGMCQRWLVKALVRPSRACEHVAATWVVDQAKTAPAKLVSQRCALKDIYLNAYHIFCNSNIDPLFIDLPYIEKQYVCCFMQRSSFLLRTNYKP